MRRFRIVFLTINQESLIRRLSCAEFIILIVKYAYASWCFDTIF